MSVISWKKPPNISFRVLGVFGFFFYKQMMTNYSMSFRVVVRAHFYQHSVFKWWGFSSTWAFVIPLSDIHLIYLFIYFSEKEFLYLKYSWIYIYCFRCISSFTYDIGAIRIRLCWRERSLLCSVGFAGEFAQQRTFQSSAGMSTRTFHQIYIPAWPH